MYISTSNYAEYLPEFENAMAKLPQHLILLFNQYYVNGHSLKSIADDEGVRIYVINRRFNELKTAMREHYTAS